MSAEIRWEHDPMKTEIHGYRNQPDYAINKATVTVTGPDGVEVRGVAFVLWSRFGNAPWSRICVRDTIAQCKDEACK